MTDRDEPLPLCPDCGRRMGVKYDASGRAEWRHCAMCSVVAREMTELDASLERLGWPS